MNKKIKVIELFNRMNENENIPKKIKYNDIEYTYDENMQEYYAYNEGRTIYFFYNVVEHKWAWLDTEVEILEDEEKIDINDIEELVGNVNVRMNNKTVDAEDLFYTISNIVLSLENSRDKTNQLIKAVKQLDKKIDKED